MPCAEPCRTSNTAEPQTSPKNCQPIPVANNSMIAEGLNINHYFAGSFGDHLITGTIMCIPIRSLLRQPGSCFLFLISLSTLF